MQLQSKTTQPPCTTLQRSLHQLGHLKHNCRSIIHHHPFKNKKYITTSKQHYVRKIVINIGIRVLPGQPMEPTPWLDQEIPAQQIKEWYYLRSLSLQQSINGTLQLESKTHVTHLTYPNFYGIRQYGVLIIPLSDAEACPSPLKEGQTIDINVKTTLWWE